MKRLYVMCVVLVMLISLCGCMNPQMEFMNSVKAHDSESAVEVWEKLRGKQEKESAVKDELKQYLNESWKAYVEGDMSLEDFQTIYDCLEQIEQDLEILPEATSVGKDFKKVEESKRNYQEGQKLSEAGDYAGAMEAFGKVIDLDSENFESAKEERARAREEYLKTIKSSVEEMMEGKNYDEAIALISNAEAVVPDPDLYEDLRHDVYTKQYTERIQEDYSAGKYLSVVLDYEQALNMDYVEISAEMTKAYTDAKATYMKDVLDRAEKAFGDKKDYKAAMDVIAKALAEADSSEELMTELNEKYESYTKYIPTPLLEIEAVKQGSHVIQGGDETPEKVYKDVNEREFNPSNMLYPIRMMGGSLLNKDPVEDEAWTITFQLNSKYSTLTGTVFRPYITLSAYEWRKDGEVRIYGDGVLIYEAPKVTKDFYDPVDFSVDITGLRELKIYISGRCIDLDKNNYAHFYPAVCLADLMVQR